VSVVRGRLVVTPVVSPRHTLKQLLARVTLSNRHAEIETGGRLGKESW
jgi:hypothetical protein